jgi:hypothetical protein
MDQVAQRVVRLMKIRSGLHDAFQNLYCGSCIALATFLESPKVVDWLERYPSHPTTDASFDRASRLWTVHVWSGKAGEIATGKVDDASGAITEAWTGPQVAWAMARGGAGAAPAAAKPKPAEQVKGTAWLSANHVEGSKLYVSGDFKDNFFGRGALVYVVTAQAGPQPGTVLIKSKHQSTSLSCSSILAHPQSCP